ncbi:uncharacterized protein BP01DRAFT_379331 [Aspergillus saccharolyticus JOP 1030-1]|uniref:Uncharacterized protein n=1 Tax=Aspergillus saccharolyticus JOP 1030-1 TaxID=1450539 RepID=A0A318ZX93_9EURO|nr:hypothetical protein BP01DRAFT_379331 [Aspergillus saccharolyticus JOP 1030-1]PYH48933.1 hypothetical protein BP01DRAFT_379331 [Aspergillus saccharolyticus JOP 1030-1]
MFRRKRSSSQHQHPLSASSTQSAQSAASHAFLKSQPSSSSLSSAAAAAALRSLTPTPTPIENVQTKRMMQRRTSVSSQLSGTPSLRPISGNGLRRSSSSASMTHRTFRDQSPRRPASSAGHVDPAPPLPSIPREYTGRNDQARRSVSMGPALRQTPRGKPMADLGSNSDSTNAPKPSARAPTRAPAATPSPELRRPASRNSINFSYPMGSRPTSPTGSIGRDASTSTSLAGQLSAAESPNRTNSSPRATRLSKTRGVSPVSPAQRSVSAGTALAAAQAAIVPRSQEVSPVAASPRRPSSQDRGVPDPAPTQQHLAPDNRHPARPSLVKRPSTVPEDAQGEVQAEITAPVQPAEPPRGGTVTPESPQTIKPQTTPDQAKDQPLSPPISPPNSQPSVDAVTELPSSHMRQSSSPGRSAHFSQHLLVANLPSDHLHQPPPRSVSPAKSALKHPRKDGLAPDSQPEAVLRLGPALSELSDGTSVASDDGSKHETRKKPAKVSFDDEAEVVGTAASPPTSPDELMPESPQAKPKSKAGWFAKRKQSLRTGTPDEFEHMLKPRLALPSFGSIRGNRAGGQPEVRHRNMSDDESTASSDSPIDTSRFSFSHDQAVGAAMTNASAEEEPQTSATHTHPATAPQNASEMSHPIDPSRLAFQVDLPDHLTKSEVPAEATQPQTPRHTLAVPDITVQPASPELEKERASLEWYEVPGGFPRSSLESDPTRAKSKRKSITWDDANVMVDAAAEQEIDDDESGESIYSDAEEGVHSNGFGSIDAVVDSQPGSTSFRESAAGLALSGKNQHNAEEWSDLEFPQTCQIARASSPAQGAPLNPIPESPSSVHMAAPFSSPYPPFATSSKSKSKQVTGPADLTRSASLNVKSGGQPNLHSRAESTATRTTAVPQSSAPRQDITQERTRPMSWSPAAVQNGAGGKSRAPVVNGEAPMPRRTLSSGSDSSSSFKRTSRPSRGDANHTMRMTMRGNPPVRPAPTRTISPPADSRLRSPQLNSSSMRTTLRMNGNKREKGTFFSNKSPKGKVTKVPGSRFTSRFPDSDDDEGFDNWRSRYRYEDSSDDDERGPAPLPPVRGIPRRQGAHDGDSTELEDSSDEERHPVASRPRASMPSPRKSGPTRDPALAAVARNRGMTDEEMDEFLQPNRGRKSSLLHRFSIRKSKSPVNRKSYTNGPPRNGSLLERSRADGEQDPPLPGAQSNVVTTITATNPPPPSSAKLVRRASQRSSRSDGWPLRTERTEPGVPPTLTSDGADERLAPVDEDARNGRGTTPASGSATKQNQHPSTTISGSKNDPATRNTAADIVIASSGRKKRFPRLRKAFGLRD